MKAVNKISQILAIVFSAAAVVLFFAVPFVTIVAGGESISLVAAELAFGGKVWKSAHIWFCFFLTSLL